MEPWPLVLASIIIHSAVVVDAALGEILTTCSKMEWLLNYGQDALRPETRHSNLILRYKKSIVLHEPLGVVAAIVSWNYRPYYSFHHRRGSDQFWFFQPYTMLGHQSSLRSSQATGLYSNAPNTSYGPQVGSSVPSRSVYANAVIIQSWFK